MNKKSPSENSPEVIRSTTSKLNETSKKGFSNLKVKYLMQIKKSPLSFATVYILLRKYVSKIAGLSDIFSHIHILKKLNRTKITKEKHVVVRISMK